MKKTFIIGLDSATFDIILPMKKEGRLPNLSRLMEGGSWGVLKSTVPPVTPPAWTSFMTGKNPGKHGVFDFYASPSYGYSRPVLNSKYIKAKTLWRILSDYGFKVGIVNLPITHPPEEINGFVIPGMQYAFNGDNFSYPPELMQDIKTKIGNYRVAYGDLESLYTNNLDKFLKEWKDILEIRRRTILYLIDKGEWDVFMAVFFCIDLIQHHFWKFYDKSHPLYDPGLAGKYGDVIPEFYEKVDSAIGDILQKIGEDINVVVVSDHGGGPEEEGFFINRWLHREGFLSFKQSLSPLWKFKFPHFIYKALNRFKFPGIAWTLSRDQIKKLGSIVDPREGLNVQHFINWNETRAYAGNHTEQGIYINLKGREHMGTVERGREYEKVRDEIIDKLKKTRDPDTGEPLEIKIHNKEEVYHGPWIDNAPDILVEIKGLRSVMHKEIHHKNLFNTSYKTSGTHRSEGMFILKGEGIKKGTMVNGTHIIDLAPTILYALGLPVPEDMDGSLIADAFEKDILKNNPVCFGSSTECDTSRDGGVLNKEESDRAKMLLRELGYFG